VGAEAKSIRDQDEESVDKYADFLDLKIFGAA